MLPVNLLSEGGQIAAAMQAPQLDDPGPDLQLLDYLGLTVRSHDAQVTGLGILRTIDVDTTPRFDATNPDPRVALRNLFTVRIARMIPTSCEALEPSPVP